jgi:hypothetical protein
VNLEQQTVADPEKAIHPEGLLPCHPLAVRDRLGLREELPLSIVHVEEAHKVAIETKDPRRRNVKLDKREAAANLDITQFNVGRYRLRVARVRVRQVRGMFGSITAWVALLGLAS